MVDAFIEWSGWIFGFIGVISTYLSHRDAQREKARSENLTQTLARSARAQVFGRQVTAEESELRSVLISVAASEGEFATAVKAATKWGGTQAELERLAVQLRQNGLLDFEDPLNPTTTILLAK